MTTTPYIFFGTSDFSIIVLEELIAKNLLPSLVVTTPDKPKGRKLILTPPPVKTFADARGIPCLQPEELNEAFIDLIREKTKELQCPFFVLASYGKILPKALTDLPPNGILNIHPSMLPKFRGASPIQSQILADEKELGITVMLMDEKMDHGPILAQEPHTPEVWPLSASVLHDELARKGGALLAKSIPEYLSGEITPIEQDHARATFCKKITKSDGELNLTDDPYQNLLKVKALQGWPGTYFFVKKTDKTIRIKIVDAELVEGVFTPTRVIPEGKKEMDYSTFLSSQ
ncbi:MAG: methionyl-tRNA formyltransferase [Candidatus Paceibacterota bacterium]